ncbi:hypothetical protein SAMN06265365_10842 [Tistlia consotensis]|uniref:Methyltransferase domain-containing protein n=1 Tax=Tistlia consotensis USBA 355 TaxID=560819 RepID=A0A1Y6BU47_9PROT|nr:hypothetical protein [Tistlia consotensis]SMF25208.1 hypothetical protein SAMN05428998_108138 [Tistlia consotensis USBA 355]SNR59830.1 hypothetical protein SAMN06265365_10842 [Tistlia consotensis]
MATNATDAARDLRTAIEQRLDSLRKRPADPRVAFLRHLLETVDFDGFRRMQQRHLESPETGREAKFLDLVYWTDAKFKLVTAFGLHACPPKRIVDIGAGNGLFALICRFYGHDVVCTDTGAKTLYDDMIDFFGLQRIIHRVEPFVPLDFGQGRFDLATAMMTTFNRFPTPWGAAEWSYFLTDLAENQLSERGEIIVKMGLRYFDADLAGHLRHLGAEVREKQGYIHVGEAATAGLRREAAADVHLAARA